MTAPTIYFVGGELEAFVAGSHASTTWATTAGTYDSDFARGAVTLTRDDITSYIRIPLTSAQATSYASFQHYRSSGTTIGLHHPDNSVWLYVVNASGAGLYRLIGVGGTAAQPLVQFQYSNAGSWTSIGSPMVIPTAALHKFDFQLIQDATVGIARCYVDGVLMGTLSGNTASVSPSAVAEIQLYTTGDSLIHEPSTITISECQILDVSTLARRLETLGETGNGTNSGWTGSVTDVAKVGTYNDSTFLQTDTANLVSTFATGTMSSVAQIYNISALVIAYRALRGATGPQNMKGAVVTAASTYASPNDVTGPDGGLVTSFGYCWADLPTNPATSANWTPAQINAGIETGVKSIT